MQRIPIQNGWYGFSTLQNDWGSSSLTPFIPIKTSRGDIRLPASEDTILYLVGAIFQDKLVMGGQSHAGFGTWLYNGIEWLNISPLSNGVSTCAFSQDGRFFYAVIGPQDGIVYDLLTNQKTPFQYSFFTDGIRAVIPPNNQIIPGNTTTYSPQYNLHEYIDFGNGLVVGQGDDGLIAVYQNKRYIIEPGGCFFNRVMFDGFNIAVGIDKQGENQTVIWFFNLNELVTFPVDNTEPPPPVNEMIEPVVTVQTWTLDELKNGREFRVKDTNNLTEGYEFRVHVKNGSMYAEIKNAKGLASTGLFRPVKECPTLPPPDPNPDPNPIPANATVKLNGKYFAHEDGTPKTLIGSSEFSLFKRYLDNDSPTLDPVINQRAALGFNILRVWLLNHSVVAFRNAVEQDMIHPNQYANFYPRLTEFVDFLGSKGFCVELTVFTQTQTLMSNPFDQQSHLDKTANAVRGRKNVILELVNENNQHDNGVWEGLVRPSGVIISHGSNGADDTGVRPTWDYELYHTNDLFEWQRKVGHNAMEKADESNAPCWSNENMRYPDKDSSAIHAFDAAAGGALLCAGSCFHSQGGKFSRTFDPTEENCAREWIAGASSVPLEFQVGSYIHRQDLEEPGIIRVYERRLSDGRGHIVKIRE